ncbi:MAG TPA: archaellin/type IV pilin N-terminal domain-containing protein [Nitrosopumilaceae archaeon]|nr:archaellin/type IV pilin N-terminal domain-containing protein [Nitrosopumilaceae archaeon]
MKTTTLKPKELRTSHKGVAPIIATLLMVAIAVVGGTIIFVFAQGFFSSSQISGTPQIEAIKILGYDARAVTALRAHDGNLMLAGSAGNGDPNVQQGERVAIYLTNDSVQKIVLGEVSFGGYIYQYVDASATGLGAYIDPNIPQGNYTMLTQTPDTLLATGAGELAPGQTATVVLDLDSDLRVGRSSQFKVTTSNGNVFVGTVSVGQQSG